jgi:hypothetical protein
MMVQSQFDVGRDSMLFLVIAVGLLLLAALIFVIAGAIVFTMRVRRGGKSAADARVMPVAALVVLVFVVLPTAAMFFFTGRNVQMPNSGTRSVMYAESSSGRTVTIAVGQSNQASEPSTFKAANEWPTASESEWVATPATSVEEAALAAAEYVSQEVTELPPTDGSSVALNLAINADGALAIALKRKLMKEHPDWTISSRHVDGPSGDKASSIHEPKDGEIELTATLRGTQQWSAVPPRDEGLLRVEIRSGSVRRSTDIRMAVKPWLYDMRGLTAGRATDWRVARSPHACASEGEATEAARNEVLRYVRFLVESRHSANHAIGDADMAALVEKLWDGSRPFVVDDVLQRMERPYGTLHKAAILYDAEALEQWVDDNARSLATSATPSGDRAARWLPTDLNRPNSLGSFLVLLLGVLATGWLLNLVSRGYYQVRILVAAALLLTALLMFVA